MNKLELSTEQIIQKIKVEILKKKYPNYEKKLFHISQIEDKEQEESIKKAFAYLLKRMVDDKTLESNLNLLNNGSLDTYEMVNRILNSEEKKKLNNEVNIIGLKRKEEFLSKLNFSFEYLKKNHEMQNHEMQNHEMQNHEMQNESFSIKEIYEVNDFNKYHDIQFIKNVYIGLLKRDADENGLNYYLDKLRRGINSKTEILCDIRYSDEGRKNNVKVLGLKKRQFYNFLTKIPILNYPIKFLKILIFLPKLERKIYNIEADINRRIIETNNKIVETNNKIVETNNKIVETNNNIFNNIENIENIFLNHFNNIFDILKEITIKYNYSVDVINNKSSDDDIKILFQFINNLVDKSEVERKEEGLLSKIDQKVDKSEFERKEEGLLSKIDQKVDKSEVERKEEGLLSKIDQKVDKSEVERKEEDLLSKINQKVDKSEVERKEEGLLSKIDQKVDKSEFERKEEGLLSKIDQKVDKSEFERKEEGLLSKIDQKVDKSEVERKEEGLLSKIDQKVDKSEVERKEEGLLSKIDQKVDKSEVERKEEDLLSKINQKIDKNHLDVFVHENTLKEIQSDLDLKLQKKVDINSIDLKKHFEVESEKYLEEAISKLNVPIQEFSSMNQDELYYSLFENVFYNSKVVKEKQKVYIEYIPKLNTKEIPHLDIGCGRGEFLYNLRENNFYAKGIDINSLEIEKLKKEKFDVKTIDLIKYLSNTEKVFSSISALQVIEHLDYDILKSFIELSYSKIAKGGVIILETINPHNKLAFNSFYMDETHKRPLPPEMIAFMLQWLGFKDIKYIYTSPLPVEFRTSDIKHNYHDYAVIGYKK